MSNASHKIIKTFPLILLSFLILVIPVFPRTVHAAGPINVNTHADDFGSNLSACSLREAVQAVYLGTGFGGCDNPDGVNQIHLSVPDYDPYTLSIPGTGEWDNATGDINIRNNLTIDGLTIIGYSVISAAVSGGNIDRVFSIAPGAVVTFTNMKIKDGTSVIGGGIYNEGTLTLQNVHVQENSALYDGGGIYSGLGAVPIAPGYDSASSYSGGIDSVSVTIPILTLIDSAFLDNTAGSNGGGIANKGGALNMSGGTFLETNTADDSGGGIYSESSIPSTIEDASFYYNIASTGDGGNIYNRGNLEIHRTNVWWGDAIYGDGGNIYSGDTGDGGSSLLIERTSITYGHSSNGGGVANDGELIMENVQLLWNNIDGNGGGLYTVESASQVSMNHVTFANNSSASGKSIYNGLFSTHPVIVHNTILGNAGDTTGACNGAVSATSSYNIDPGTTCNLPGGQNNQSTTDPQFDSYKPHGYYWFWSYGLAITSPAVDTADPLTADPLSRCPATDVRGALRPIDGNRDGISGCDIGAFELELIAYVPVIMK
jgi:CSLREA domain-containing protein